VSLSQGQATLALKRFPPLLTQAPSVLRQQILSQPQLPCEATTHDAPLHPAAMFAFVIFPSGISPDAIASMSLEMWGRLPHIKLCFRAKVSRETLVSLEQVIVRDW
jgi:hypothetical protein